MTLCSFLNGCDVFGMFRELCLQTEGFKSHKMIPIIVTIVRSLS